jgi:glycosidase
MLMRRRTFAAGLALAAALPGACRQADAPAAAAATVLAPDTSWVRRAAIYEVFVQDFSTSGDFRGVISGLDRIQRAGADVVWLMPIHPIGVLNRKDPLGSPYAASDFRAFNPAYGGAEDFRALVDSVHGRGMKLIIDWVPDHTSWDAVWTREHPDFYVRDSAGRFSVPRDAQGNLTNWTDVIQLDYTNPTLRREMIATMRWWLSEFNLDGFRVDVAGFVPLDFWREALHELRAAVPRPIMLLAEWADLELHRAGFDLTYGWDGYGRLKAVWRGDTAATFVRRIVADADSMPAGGMRLRFTTNHDETAWDNPPVTLFGGSAGARAAFVAMALLPGRPMLYNGQEVESPQQLGLFVRDTVVWGQRGADSARAFYARVLRLAKQHPAILRGTLHEVRTTAPLDVIAYRRDSTVVLVNTRARPARFTVDGGTVDGMRDLLSGRAQTGATVTLPAFGAVVLAK